MANIMTLVRIVMAPTAISPPYFRREELKHTEIMPSLLCIMKVEVPSPTQGRIMAFWRPSRLRRRRSCVFLPIKKARTQMQERAWERTVASAPPRTPMFMPKIKMGSRIILVTAPISTESIPVFAKPWAVINAFMPRVSCTKMVPRA